MALLGSVCRSMLEVAKSFFERVMQPINLERRQISVRHSDLKGQLTSPKNGRGAVRGDD